MANLLHLGLQGLNAARAGLNVTGQNISNVNTAGYHRKNLVQSATYPVSAGYGFPGNGVHLDDVARVYDRFLDEQVRVSTAKDSFHKTQMQYLHQLDEVIANSTNGVSPRLQEFFKSLQTLTADPSSIPSRQAMVDQMSSLVTTLKSSDARMDELRLGVNTEVRSSVTAINGLATQIASLNKQISHLWRNDQKHLPNDLIDQRDQAVTELNKYINASMVMLDDGSANVYIGNGQSLVLGSDTMLLKADLSKFPGREQELTVYYQKGAEFEVPSSMLTGGSLGGALEVRRTLDKTQQHLGQMTMEIVKSFNEQNKHGVDFNGDQGKDFFNLNFSFPPLNQNADGTLRATPEYAALTAGEKVAVQHRYAVKALELAQTDPRKIAAASSVVFDRANSKFMLGSTAALSQVSTSEPFHSVVGGATSPKLPITLKFDGDQFKVWEGSPAVASTEFAVRTVPGVTGGYEIVDKANAPTGVHFTLTGSAKNGDELVIAARPGGAFTDTNENNNLIAMARLQVKDTVITQVAADERTKKLFGTDANKHPLVTAQGSFNAGTNRVDFAIPAQDPESHGEYAQRQFLAKMPMSINFDGTTLTNLPDDFAVVGTVADGFKIQTNVVSGTPPTTTTTTETVMVLKLHGAGGAAPTAATLSLPAPSAANFQATFGQLATEVGSKTNEVKVEGQAAAVTLKQVSTARESVSGVDLDEEAANLMKYQQAYQAASKAIQVGQGLFDAVLQALR